MAKTLMDRLQSYRFHTFRIPRHMREEIVQYIGNGEIPSEFMLAVLRNDLKSAVLKGNKAQLENFPVFVNFMSEHAPAECWGSKAAVAKWIATPKRGD